MTWVWWFKKRKEKKHELDIFFPEIDYLNPIYVYNLEILETWLSQVF